MVSQMQGQAYSRSQGTGTLVASSGSGSTDSSKTINQTLTINSPKSLSPAETARQNKRALQELAFGF